MRTNPDTPVSGTYNRVGQAENKNGGLTIRELFTLEAMKARLLNVSMYDRHGCQYEAVAHDAVKWADATIAELNKTAETNLEVINNNEGKENESTTERV